MTQRDGRNGDGALLTRRGRGDESGTWSPAVELDVLTRGLGRKLDAEIVVLFGAGDVGRPAEAISSWGLRAPSGRLALPGREGLVGRMLESERAVVGPLDPALDRALVEAAGARTLTHAALVPVASESSRLGILFVGFSSAPPGEPSVTRWVAESYARLAALSLHDPGVLDELLQSAHHDGLTGCLNYASVRAELITEIKRSARHDLVVSCCFLDLDGFKGINDRYGHVYGNGVLAEIGATLRSNLREFDTVGRYGGDEFFAILPETTERQAMALAARLCSSVRALALPSGDPLEASVGIAQWMPGWSAELMLGEADRALYAAKGTRGGIVTSGELCADEPVRSVDQVA